MLTSNCSILIFKYKTIKERMKKVLCIALSLFALNAMAASSDKYRPDPNNGFGFTLGDKIDLDDFLKREDVMYSEKKEKNTLIIVSPKKKFLVFEDLLLYLTPKSDNLYSMFMTKKMDASCELEQKILKEIIETKYAVKTEYKVNKVKDKFSNTAKIEEVTFNAECDLKNNTLSFSMINREVYKNGEKEYIESQVEDNKDF